MSPTSARPRPERVSSFAGFAFFFGCLAVLLAAAVWGVAATWAPAPAVATFIGGVGVILLCAAFKWVRLAGYEARRLEEWEEAKWRQS